MFKKTLYFFLKLSVVGLLQITNFLKPQTVTKTPTHPFFCCKYVTGGRFVTFSDNGDVFRERFNDNVSKKPTLDQNWFIVITTEEQCNYDDITDHI